MCSDDWCRIEGHFHERKANAHGFPAWNVDAGMNNGVAGYGRGGGASSHGASTDNILPKTLIMSSLLLLFVNSSLFHSV